MNNITVTRAVLPDFDEYVQEIRELWDSHWITNMGTKHHQLQQALEQRMGCHVVLFTNGHLALENALACCDFPPGSEVITTPFTFASTTHAIARTGLTPVFCDIDPVDFTLDEGKLESLITPRTVAVLPVHVYGNLCHVEEIQRIAGAHGLKVIYDAAHAFAQRYNGTDAGCFGDISMFSFHATKVFNTIEGGCLCFRQEELRTQLNDRKNFGIRRAEEVAYIGGNAKMSEFQAAMGLCNLRHLDGEIAKRRALHLQYFARLEGIHGIRLNPVQNGVESNYTYFPVLFDGYQYTRDQVFERLAAQGIGARKYFYPLTNCFDCYRSLPTAGADNTPVAAFVADRVLTLPLYGDLSPDDVDRICDIILS